jgi:hypothetical protein
VIRVISILLLSTLAFSSIAQKKKKENANDAKLLSDHAEWSEGSILLSDGDELKGLVKYNDRNGILSFQDGGDARVFTPLRVSAFEFFDERLQKQRVFYTLTYEDVETSMDRPLFFEVLKEYKDFAILSRANRIDVTQKADFSPWDSYSQGAGSYNNSMIGPNSNVKLVVSQSEIIYIMKSTGEINPYFMIVNEEDGQKSFIYTGKDTKTKNKMLDRDLLEEFVPPERYEKLKDYARENKLSFKKKDDFLKILGYYDQLIGK